MPARPGTAILLRETPPPRSAPTDTGIWFVVGMAEKGPLRPVRITSMADYARHFGARTSYSSLYDALDTYFHEGGAAAYISRVVGPAPVLATVTLMDASAGASLKVNAKSPGEWGNALNVAVLAGDTAGNFKIQVSHDTVGVLETSPDLVDKAAAIGWGQYNDYVTLISDVSNLDPATIAATGLTGGADDRTNVTDSNWQAALDLIAIELGPGQVSMPGRTTGAAYTAVLQHALDRNRVALLDGSDTSSKAALLTAVGGNRLNGRWGSYWAPWLLVPGIVAGTTRTVPPSGLIAALITRNDPVNGPNSPAAGVNGQAVWALGLAQPPWPDADREDLNNSGVDVIITKYGGVRAYGWRSMCDPVSDANWISWGNARLVMGIKANLDPIMEQFLFTLIDGQGFTIAEFGGAVTAEVIPYWTNGQLFGATPDEAFYVDVGSQVNTPETIANGELRAVLSVRMSPFAEYVQIELVKRAVTERVV